MSDESQEDVIAFLSDGANLPGGASAKLIRTHGAIVFLSGCDAYKMKRAMRYDYLDFSTLQKRHDMLLRELELNAPAAPTIYRDVIAVTRDVDGMLHLDGQGDVVEWVLRMRRFDAADELRQVAEQGALDDQLAATLGESVANYHAAATPRPGLSGADLIAGVLEELNTAFASMTDMLPPRRIARYSTTTERAFHDVREHLDRRGQSGDIRRGHGDLHMGNIVILNGAPTLFDALEFDEVLGTCDVLYDLAFLLMDLRHGGFARAANIVLSSYLFHSDSLDHYASLSLLPLFQSMRAAIRAMVTVQAARLDPGDAGLGDTARAYLAEALTYLEPAAARMIAIGGLSGTGKTVLARSLAPQVGAAPGAVHLRSDLERKALFDVSPLTRLPPCAYEPDVTAKVYARMRDKAHRILTGGHSVVMDATWQNAQERDALSRLAEDTNAGFNGVWLTADIAILQKRVSARRNDASDADSAVVRAQAEQAVIATPWAEVDASGSLDDTRGQVCSLLCRDAESPCWPE